MPLNKELRRHPRLSLALAIEAFAALFVAWFAVKFLPFKKTIELGGRSLARRSPPRELVPRVRRNIVAVSSRVPWRSVCIEQGLAMQWMLRRRGIDARLHYGANLGSNGTLAAHVWVTAGDEIVIGEEATQRFVQIASFP